MQYGRYTKADTLVHSLDARSKLAAVVGVSLATVLAPAVGVACVGVLAAVVARASRLRVSEILDDVKPALFILVFGALARGVTLEGGVGVSLTGLWAGAVASGRFVVILALAYVFSATTSPNEIKLAVEYILAPLPFVREKDWGTMFAAAFRFFPLMFEEVERVREAQKARLGDEAGIRRRVLSMTLPLFARSFRRADSVSLAMAARAYSPERTSLRRLEWSKRDTFFVAASAVTVVALVIL